MGDLEAFRQAPLRGAGLYFAGAILGVGLFGREGGSGVLVAHDLRRPENPDGWPGNSAGGCRLGWEPAFEARLADLPAAGGVQRGLLFRVSDPGYTAFAVRDGGGVGVLAADAGRATGLDDPWRVALVGQDRRPYPGLLGHSDCELGEHLWKHIYGGAGVRGGLPAFAGAKGGVFFAADGRGVSP